MRQLSRALFVVALSVVTLCALCLNAAAQTLRPENDPRNTAPTVGTGGPVGGPTGLFTVYDGDTLRRGEFTFSVAYSNYDRDPGNVDIVETPLSVQVGINDYLEVFFNTDGYRGIKVNNPQNLSSFYLPNSQLAGINGVPGAIVAAPFNSRRVTGSVYRPGGSTLFTRFPFAGAFGTVIPQFYPSGFNASTGVVISTNSGGRFGGPADVFPGIGSPVGGILPGIVFPGREVYRTSANAPAGATCSVAGQVYTGALPVPPNCVPVPVSFTTAPSYLPDAPFINRRYGETAFNTFMVGAKIRFTRPDKAYSFGILPFYRFYYNNANTASGFNQLQRGGSPGAKTGDFGAYLFADGRLTKHINVSGNLGYIINTNPRSTAFGTSQPVTLLDRPNELQVAIGFDFPVNRYFQPIVEVRRTFYVGGRTPNAFEVDPADFLGGIRIFPKRWFGFSAAYRVNLNEQKPNTAPAGFVSSNDPNGFLVQFFAGHRNARAPEFVPNNPPVISSFTADRSTITVCPRDVTLNVPPNSQVTLTTVASDPDGDTLLYNYSATAGRVTGNGTTATLDLTGVAPGTTVTTTVEVNDGCGCVTTASTTINVVECPTPTPTPLPACPTINVSCPTVGKVGDPATVTASVSGGDPSATYTYNWSVSAGTITAGQGTNSITVDTTGLGGQTVTATVTVGGVPANCTNSQSCTFNVPPAPQVPVKVDEVEYTRFNDLKARLDNFAIALQNDPTSQGYIIAYGGRRGTAGEAQRLADRAKEYLVNNRGIDAGRIATVDGGYRERLSLELWRVPSGATPPTASPTLQPSDVQTRPARRAPRRTRRRGEEDDE